MHLHQLVEFPVEFISQEIIERRREIDAKVCEQNQNKFDWETVIKYNMQASYRALGLSIFVYLQNCKAWLTPYDVLWKCKYK